MCPLKVPGPQLALLSKERAPRAGLLRLSDEHESPGAPPERMKIYIYIYHTRDVLYIFFPAFREILSFPFYRKLGSERQGDFFEVVDFRFKPSLV